jgi:hypothetical protein
MTETTRPEKGPPTRDLTAVTVPPAVRRPDVMEVRREGLPNADLRSLLQKRLRFLASLATLAAAAVPALAISSPGSSRPALAFYCLVFVAVAALAGLLWKPLLSLRRLRRIELLLFGILFADWALVQAGIYPSFHFDDPPNWFPPVLAYAVCLPWVFIIFVYGILIPNNWRRCAAVVGAAAALPLLISATTGLAATATGGHNPAIFWVPMAMWVALAAACSIFCAHRIEILRVEASDACKLGPYQLKQCLGSGGMGEVYLAEHILIRRPCAVKLIRPDWAANPSALARFEREVQATAALTHPNTVQIFDYGHAEDGTFYYAMEYLPGMSLEQMVKKDGPLPPGRAVYFLRQVCGALREAHAAGLIHRDIKPGNMIACERGGRHDVLKLLDFGLVLTHGPDAGADNLTVEGAITGTPAYMSPEQAEAKRDLDGRSDVYSLGAVAYYLLTGQPPFVRSSTLQILAAHLLDSPDPTAHLRPEVPSDLQDVVLRCLAKDAGQRFADVGDLDRALAACGCAGQWGEDRAAAWWRSLSI